MLRIQIVLRVSANQTTTDGRPKGEHRRRNPLGSRPVSENGLAREALHERDRTSDVIKEGTWSCRASVSECYMLRPKAFFQRLDITLCAVLSVSVSQYTPAVSTENIHLPGFCWYISD